MDLKDEKLLTPSEVRKRAKEAAAKRLQASGRSTSDAHKGVDLEISMVHHGVTVSWLAQVFDMDPKTVKKRLAGCPYVRRKASRDGRRGQVLYELKTASAYLVDPVIDLETYMKSVKVEDLPTRFQEGFWAAQLKKQKWEENAGDLWRTDAVLDSFGKVFQKIKFTLQLWSDQLERAHGLSIEQQDTLQVLTDGLQDDIFKSLEEMGMNSNTQPLLAELSPPEEADLSDVL